VDDHDSISASRAPSTTMTTFAPPATPIDTEVPSKPPGTTAGRSAASVLASLNTMM
jgi:hypothetical protein